MELVFLALLVLLMASALASGFPVAFILGGLALLFLTSVFDDEDGFALATHLVQKLDRSRYGLRLVSNGVTGQAINEIFFGDSID